MKRFLLVLALVAVAGATYVATAPGGQTASPTAKQFRALKKQVAALSNKVKGVQGLAVAEAVLLTDCMKYSVPIDQFGDSQNTPGTYGYEFSDPSVSGTPFLTTGLDTASPGDPTALWITGGDATCGTDINGALRKVSRLSGIRFHAAPRAFSAGKH